MAGGKISDAIFRPHRMFGLRGPLEFMFHPNDKYNRPKQESAAAPTTTDGGAQLQGSVAPAVADAFRRKQGAKQPAASGYGATAPLSVGGG